VQQSVGKRVERGTAAELERAAGQADEAVVRVGEARPSGLALRSVVDFDQTLQRQSGQIPSKGSPLCINLAAPDSLRIDLKPSTARSAAPAAIH
jgi:hypothetical protein